MAFQKSWDELSFSQSFHPFDHPEITLGCWDHWNQTGCTCLQLSLGIGKLFVLSTSPYLSIIVERCDRRKKKIKNMKQNPKRDYKLLPPLLNCWKTSAIEVGSPRTKPEHSTVAPAYVSSKLIKTTQKKAFGMRFLKTEQIRVSLCCSICCLPPFTPKYGKRKGFSS